MRKFFFFLFIFILIPVVSNTNHYKKPGKYGKYDGQIKNVIVSKENTIKKNYCTKTFNKIEELEGNEKRFEIYDYHETDENKREINLKEISGVVKDRTISGILSDLYCLKFGDRGSVAKLNDVKGLALIHDAFLDSERSILKIPDGIILQISDLELNNAFYKEVVSEVQGPELPPDEGGDKPKPTEPTKPEPEPEPVFDTEKRDKLESAAEIKKLEFDEEINKLQGLKDEANTNYEQLKINYQTSLTKVDETLKYTKNTDILEIREKLKKLENLKKEHFEGTKLKSLKDAIRSIQTDIDGLVKSEDYKSIKKLITKIQNAEKKKNHSFIKNQTVEKIEKRQLIEATGLEGKISVIKTDISTFDLIIQNSIDPLREEIDKLDLGDDEDKFVQFILDIAIYIAIFLFVVAVSVFIYLQSRKIKKLSKMSQSAETKFSDMENKLKTTSEKINLARTAARSRSSLPPEPPPEEPKTVVQIRTEKFEDLKRDYQEALDNFSKVAGFKQKWRGLALSRKERQETAKTVLINSSRSFEKSEIWCLSFEEKYIAYPGSSVKTNMSIYMNFDFQKAQFDFKGIFNITSGSSYSVKPCTLRRGGAGFVVEHAGEIQFPK